MNHGCVTLDEVFAAASLRAASLVPETSGYLALAIGDATSRLPLLHDDRALLLTTEGGMSASRRGDVVTPEKAAKAMRDVLARLLAVSSGTMPGLAAAARPREESARGVDAVIEEIEAALIPVNRAAAQRALARLSRETLRAKDAGKLKPKREASVRPPPRPAAAAAPRGVFFEPPAPPVIAEPSHPVFTEPPTPAVFTEPRPLAPRIEAALVVEAKAVVAEAPPVVPERDPIAAESLSTVHAVGTEARATWMDAKRMEAALEAKEIEAALEAKRMEAALEAKRMEAALEAEEIDAALEAEQMEADAVAEIVVAEALSPAVEAVTVVPVEQVVVAHEMPLIEAPAPTPAPTPASLEPRFEVRNFAEPTPTTLGTSMEIDEATTPFSAMEGAHATELASAAFVEEDPVAVIHAPVFQMPVIPAASLAPPSGPTTRADDLLATFGVSCSDAEALREATDCLKKLADLEPTPAPLAVAPPAPKPIAPPAAPRDPVVAAPKIARAVPPPAPLPAPKAQPALDSLRDQLEEQGRSPRKRGRSGLSLVAALLAGAVVGLVAVTRLRPDLVTSFEERVGPALGSERPAPPAPAAHAR